MIGDRAPWSLDAAQVGFDSWLPIQNPTNKQRGRSILSQNRPKSDITGVLEQIHYITLKVFAMTMGNTWYNMLDVFLKINS